MWKPGGSSTLVKAPVTDKYRSYSAVPPPSSYGNANSNEANAPSLASLSIGSAQRAAASLAEADDYPMGSVFGGARYLGLCEAVLSDSHSVFGGARLAISARPACTI